MKIAEMTVEPGSSLVGALSLTLLRKPIKARFFFAGTALGASLFTASFAHAQCTVTGILADPQFNLVASGAIFASSTSNALVAALNTMNTAFTTQSSAFAISPAASRPDEQSGGTWTRAVGERVNVNNTGVMTFGILGPGGVTSIPGDVTCNARTRQELGGIQVGHDFARLNLGGSGWNIHLGATAGYIGSEAKSDVNKIGFQVPFVGLYAVAVRGNFFADAQVRWDSYQMNVTNPAASLANQALDARSVSVSGSAGYNFAVGSFFIEPSVGIIHSSLKVDPLLTVNATFNLPGLISFDDIKSTLGRAGVRIGTSVTAGNFALQPFAAATIWREFAKDATASYLTCFACVLPPPVLEFGGRLSTSRVGTYTQWGVGLFGQLRNTSWFGYTRFDYKKGDNVEGSRLSGGLRYQLGT